MLTLSLLFRSLPKSGKLNFAPDLSINETEASDCGLDVFYEKVFIHIHIHVHDIMKNPFPVHDSDWASGLCRPVQRRISNTQGEFSKSYLVLQYFRHNAHCTLRQAVVLANSDCQLEDQTAIETLKETLLSSLHDVINCVRCDHTSTCLLYIYCWLYICISTAYLLYSCISTVYLLYITWPLSLIRSGNTKLRLEKLLLLLPCLRHVDTIIRMFWAKIKQVHIYI